MATASSDFLCLAAQPCKTKASILTAFTQRGGILCARRLQRSCATLVASVAIIWSWVGRTLQTVSAFVMPPGPPPVAAVPAMPAAAASGQPAQAAGTPWQQQQQLPNAGQPVTLAPSTGMPDAPSEAPPTVKDVPVKEPPAKQPPVKDPPATKQWQGQDAHAGRTTWGVVIVHRRRRVATDTVVRGDMEWWLEAVGPVDGD